LFHNAGHWPTTWRMNSSVPARGAVAGSLLPVYGCEPATFGLAGLLVVTAEHWDGVVSFFAAGADTVAYAVSENSGD